MARRTNGKRNRQAGHNFERRVAELLRDSGFPEAISTRQGSRYRDAQGIDIMNAEEAINGRLPYNIQCKNTSVSLNYAKLLESLPKEADIINVIFHKFTERKEGGKFHPRGHFAILDMHDFLALVKKLEEYKL